MFFINGVTVCYWSNGPPRCCAVSSGFRDLLANYLTTEGYISIITITYQ